MKEKIAVLTDSGSNVTKGINNNLFILPLLIHIEDTTYIDGVDITLAQVLEVIDLYRITTSLPSPEVIVNTLDNIKRQGYTHVIVNTISSGLSDTFNTVRLIAQGFKDLEIALLDTKNISKGSGYTTVSALELIKEGKTFKEIVKILEERMNNNKVFFTIKSLEYLRKGGRIGLVASTIANIINLKPIISCNEEGVYHTVKKQRGYQKAINRTLKLALSFVKSSKSYDISLLVTKIDETVESTKAMIKKMFTKMDNFEVVKVSPALAIHLGLEAIGIALRKKE